MEGDGLHIGINMSCLYASSGTLTSVGCVRWESANHCTSGICDVVMLHGLVPPPVFLHSSLTCYSGNFSEVTWTELQPLQICIA